jgi:hypothetical protein
MKEMLVHIELQNTGDPGTRAEISAAIEHALADRPGEWRVSIIARNRQLGDECTRAKGI